MRDLLSQKWSVSANVLMEVNNNNNKKNNTKEEEEEEEE